MNLLFIFLIIQNVSLQNNMSLSSIKRMIMKYENIIKLPKKLNKSFPSVIFLLSPFFKNYFQSFKVNNLSVKGWEVLSNMEFKSSNACELGVEAAVGGRLKM